MITLHAERCWTSNSDVRPVNIYIYIGLCITKAFMSLFKAMMGAPTGADVITKPQ